MDLTPQPSITETLANLSIASIFAIVGVLTLVRLALVRTPSGTARSIAEVVESGIIAIVLVFLIIRPFVLQAYFIPSPSMEPTLLGKDNVGDRILVNKFLYRVDKPHDEDVVVFLAPPAAMAGNPDFIKRLMGQPGDTIQVVGGHVVINGTPFDHEEVRDHLAHAGFFGPDAEVDQSVDQADHHVKFVDGGVLADNKFIPADQLAEPLAGLATANVQVEPGYVIRNGKRLNEDYIAEDPDYDLKLIDGKPLKHDYGAVDTNAEFRLADDYISQEQYDAYNQQPSEAIPAAEYLMMGDNRNDSNDGTNWGLLDEDRIVGKAQFIFWPIGRIHFIR